VCLIDPVGDVYECPFVIDRQFVAGNVRDPGGFEAVWRSASLFASLCETQTAGACASCGSFDACRGGCMAAKFFIGLPLDGRDPECVHGHGATALASLAAGTRPHAVIGHSKVTRDGTPVPVPTRLRSGSRADSGAVPLRHPDVSRSTEGRVADRRGGRANSRSLQQTIPHCLLFALLSTGSLRLQLKSSG
jgi:mycofactocin biosynthetic radical S-adenosylmethionine protein MftC